MALNLKSMSALPGIIRESFSSKKGTRHNAAYIAGYRQLAWQILALIAFFTISFWAINQLRINGPMYKKLVEYQGLRADILSPVLYPVEAFSAINEAYVAASVNDIEKRDKALAELDLAEDDFKQHVQLWRGSLKDQNLLDDLEIVVNTGEHFFLMAKQKYKPALTVSPDAARDTLTQITAIYAINKAAVNKFAFDLDIASKHLTDSQSQFAINTLYGLGLFAMFLVLLMLFFGRKQIKALDAGVQQLKVESEHNQQAVFKLLDEMGDLADGDLTVKAEVTESITGAIADSINYTIESLRDLVEEINRASEHVNKATAQAQDTSESLLLAAGQQSKQILDTSDAVEVMTGSILQVSKNAEEASQVAKRSLEAASQGTQAVQNTISGMNEIRTQIQETSNRIKRLGESSQEISEIVELLSDISEQTNILALNAAIQAASAGDAGRGFTVVAEEVQRLAERSSEATKQISAIVKTIQTDTASAVVAMQKSTEGVVDGTRLSDAAGQALREISTVTNSLADLIASISDATSAQTEVAAKVSRNMHQIQSITSQTTEGTKLTAQSVGQLSRLAEDLSASVAGFKLS